MQSLQCRQLLQHPSDPPQLCPDCPQGWCFSPQPCTYPRIYAARMNASSRKCLCKKTAFFLPFLGFFFPHPIWFSADCSWVKLALVPGASSRDVPGARCWERAEWDSPFWQPSVMWLLWGDDFGISAGLVWILTDDLYPLWLLLLFDLPDFKATVVPLEKCEPFPKLWILKCKHTHREEVNLSLLLFLQGFALFPCLPCWGGPYPQST